MLISKLILNLIVAGYKNNTLKSFEKIINDKLNQCLFKIAGTHIWESKFIFRKYLHFFYN